MPYFNTTRFVKVLLAVLLSLTLWPSSALAGPIEDLAPGQWLQIPNSKMIAVDPCPARNCPYSGVEGGGSVIWSWSGGAYDTSRDRLIVWGGGHTAYAGNEVYAFDLNTFLWTRVTEPSDITGHVNGATYPSDGRPASVHSYDQIEYDPVADRMFAFGGSRWQSGSNTSTAFTFNFDTKNWTQVADIIGDSYSENIGLSLNSAYDPVTGLVYIGGAWTIATYNVNTNVWKTLNRNYGGWGLPNGLTAALDYNKRQFVQIGRGYAFIWDISVAAPVRQNLVTTGAKEIESCDAPGMDYDPTSGKIVAWCKGSDVYTLDVVTKVWTKITAGSSVTPGDPYLADSNYHGTFGRFRYVPSKNVFVVVTDQTKDVFVYKLPTGAGPSGDIGTPALTFTASPTTVVSGGSSTLVWSSSGVTSCTASGSWSGALGLSGSVTVNPTVTSTYTLTCTGPGGSTTQSATVTVTSGSTPPPTGGSLPTPWVLTDIGAPTPAGTASVSAGAYTVVAGGADIWDNADQFSFINQPFTGDTEIIARVDSLMNTHQWAKSGIMIRDALTPGSTHAAILVTPTSGITFQRRTAQDGTSTSANATSAGTAPRYLRLVRTGTSITAYYGDGATGPWTLAGSITVSMNGTDYIGLAATSHVQGTGMTTSLSNVNIGAVTASSTAPTVTISASPTTIASGEATTITWSSLDATSCTASGAWSGALGLSGSVTVNPTVTSTYTLTCTGPGGSTTQSATVTVNSAPSSTGLPAPWTLTDIGAPTPAGSATFANNTFTVTVGGPDIWGNTDHFAFINQPITGDAEIIARVESLVNTASWAKAGVMIRDSLTGGSTHAMMVITPSNGISFQRRLTTDGTSVCGTSCSSSGVAPAFVRLVRVGTTISAYYGSSATGPWTLTQSITIAMTGTDYIGLAVTSNNASAATTAVISGASVAN